MKKNIFSPPEPFSLSPLLSLLPVRGKLAGLPPLTSSLFARFEKVSGMLKEIESGSAMEIEKRLLAEQSMLKQVLEWLEVTPETGS